MASLSCVDMPLEVVDMIVLSGGIRAWFFWRTVSKRWAELPATLRHKVCIVPDDQPSILKGISHAPDNADGGGPFVLVRPGVYAESVRVLRDVTLVGMGGEVVVRAPGWEAALVWGGYTVRKQKLLGDFDLEASNGGAGASVHNLTLTQRNMSQALALYCTWGTPLVSHCRILGTVHVAGRGAAPTVRDCTIEGSIASGLRVVDHAGGVYERNRLRGNRLAGAHLSLNSRATLASSNAFDGNGFDEVVRGDAAWGASLDTREAEEGEDDSDCVFGEEAFEELLDPSGAAPCASDATLRPTGGAHT